MNSGLMGAMSSMITGVVYVMALTGVIIVIFAILKWARGGRSGYNTFPVSLTIFGTALIALPLVLPILLGSAGSLGETAGDGKGPKKTPAPTPTKAPTPEPPLDPGQFLPVLVIVGIVLGVLGVLAVLYFGLRKVLSDRAVKLELQTEKDELRARLQAKWDDVVRRHEKLKAKFLDAEMNWDVLFSLPALTDPTVPQTTAMLRAMQAANDADNVMPTSLLIDDNLSKYPYPKAVGAFAVAWRAAEHHARAVGQSLIPAEERKTIQQIRDLLAVAQDSGASANERQMAYRRIQTLMKSLRSIAVPERVMQEIEEQKRLALAA